jgi:hypothetical protein
VIWIQLRIGVHWAIEEVLAQIKYTALKAGLVINESKTKYMRIMRNEMGDRSDLRVEGMVCEEVTTFKYYAP